MERVSVVGNSGSGKSTLGVELARRLAVARLELDAVRHQAGWTELPDDEFRERVAAFVSGPAWVVDGNYGVVRDLVWARADTVVWLDLPRSVVMRSVTARTLRRMVTREELWNGNRERLRDLFRRAPEQSVILATWQFHSSLRERLTEVTADPINGHLVVHRLRTRDEVEAFVQSVLDRTVG